jgi:hypothetical protein
MKLTEALEKIQNSIGKELIEFDKFFPFGGNFEFEATDFFNNIDQESWRLVDRYSGKLETGLTYEVGVGSHWGSIVFCISPNQKAAIILEPEFGIGIVFLCASEEMELDRDAWQKDFYYSSEWKIECATDCKLVDYIRDWVGFFESLSIAQNVKAPH